LPEFIETPYAEKWLKWGNSSKFKSKKEQLYQRTVEISWLSACNQSLPDSSVFLYNILLTDTYIHNLSHGICPSCIKELYPDKYEMIMAGKSS
jgi:hypothetical protein